MFANEVLLVLWAMLVRVVYKFAFPPFFLWGRQFFSKTQQRKNQNPKEHMAIHSDDKPP